MRRTLAQLNLTLEPTGLASAHTYAHTENVIEHIRAMPLGSTVIIVRRAGALLVSASFNFGGAHVDHEAHAADAEGTTALSHGLERRGAARQAHAPRRLRSTRGRMSSTTNVQDSPHLRCSQTE